MRGAHPSSSAVGRCAAWRWPGGAQRRGGWDRGGPTRGAPPSCPIAVRGRGTPRPRKPYNGWLRRAPPPLTRKRPDAPEHLVRRLLPWHEPYAPPAGAHEAARAVLADGVPLRRQPTSRALSAVRRHAGAAGSGGGALGRLPTRAPTAHAAARTPRRARPGALPVFFRGQDPPDPRPARGVLQGCAPARS